MPGIRCLPKFAVDCTPRRQTADQIATNDRRLPDDGSIFANSGEKIVPANTAIAAG